MAPPCPSTCSKQSLDACVPIAPEDRPAVVRAGSLSRQVRSCLAAFAGLGVALSPVNAATRATTPAFLEAKPPESFAKYCFECHGKTKPEADLNIEKLVTQSPIGLHFNEWDSIAEMLETSKMPPDDASEFPTNEERLEALSWIRSSLKAYETAHAGEPGRVTVRRLTSGEYAYAVRDLTGIDIPVTIDASSDSVGGEGFTNFGDVQFVQDTSIERYLESAKMIADHAVVGAGPLQFYADTGKTGLELSALNRINELYSSKGFRVVSAEGGRPFGLERYGKAFFVSWQFKHRAALGMPGATLRGLAAKEGITGRFAEHVWSVVSRPNLRYPSQDMVARWKSLPTPGSDVAAAIAGARSGCDDLYKYLTTWPSWFFARGDLAAGGAGDESPLVFDDEALKAEPLHKYSYILGIRGNERFAKPSPGPVTVFMTLANVNPTPGVKPAIIWRNPRIVTRGPDIVDPKAPTAAEIAAGALRIKPTPGAIISTQPLRSLLPADIAAKLAFGKSPDGSAIGPDDFVTTDTISFPFEIPTGGNVLIFEADAELGTDRNAVVRVMVTDRAEGNNARDGKQRIVFGDPASEGYKTFRAGMAEYASLLPPNSHGEANPADKDPVPPPFDNTYNGAEHDAFVLKVKYQRSDKFFVENMVDGADRDRLNQAWNDLFSSWPYHNAYLAMLTSHYALTLKSPRIQDLDAAQIEALPKDAKPYIAALRQHYDQVMKIEADAEKGHLENALLFASRAWRRPLAATEKKRLKAFYQQSRIEHALDHDDAIRALLARILVSPAFVYRVETGAAKAERPLNDWEMASRLSFFLWSSIPDDELRRAAAAGELGNPTKLAQQVKRMTADPKARRLATEFFGQWLGFYRFDQFRGVDTGYFTEFTDEVKLAMYDESVSTFEYLIRNERPIKEIINADYTFLNRPLAKFYGIEKAETLTDDVVRVDGANAFNRGGALRLGTVLTTTSAPRRTSPVKRGDWVLRRILGTPTPPPPPDAGSLPADPKAFGGLTLRERLEVHKRNPSCANCHVRIDPMGFPLEGYDAVGRWRTAYQEGTAVDVTSEMPDKSVIVGADDLLKYIQGKEAQVTKTLVKKMLGYALGRTVIASDYPLVHEMTAAGGSATFSDLATKIVTSRQFRNRQGEEDPKLSINLEPGDNVAGVNSVSQKTQDSP
jgi:hypothetical protein